MKRLRVRYQRITGADYPRGSADTGTDKGAPSVRRTGPVFHHDDAARAACIARHPSGKVSA